jgi:hypothetical protein
MLKPEPSEPEPRRATALAALKLCGSLWLQLRITDKNDRNGHDEVLSQKHPEKFIQLKNIFFLSRIRKNLSS